jgi:hypothetical protein
MNIILKRIFFVSNIIILVSGIVIAEHDPRYNIKRPESQRGASKLAAEQFQAYHQGFDMQAWMGNMSVIGINFDGNGRPPEGQYGLEYPQGSGIEHLYGAAPWIGALVDTSTSGTPRIIKAVTTGYEGWSGPLFEMFGNPDGSDLFYRTTNTIQNGHNRRGYDDDHDGKVDEDELNGIDDDHDGFIDEDYGAVSEQDAYVGFGDLYGDPRVVGHVPLGIKIWQRSFAWSSGTIPQPMLPIEYYFMNVGNKTLRDVYVGFFADCDVGPRNVSGYFSRNSSGYFPDIRTAYVFNSVDRPSTPIGITVLGTPKSLDSLSYTFHWYPGGGSPTPDIARYNLMASGRIDPDEYPSISDTRFFFSFGPFDSVKTGDTLKIVVAIVSGEGISEGRNNMKDNAAAALELYARGFTAPPPPATPPMHVQVGDDRVTLNWKWLPEDIARGYHCDPLQTWDDSNKFVGSLPADHWRRRNPEERCDTLNQTGGSGGRSLEGFRVWRSESPTFPAPAGSYALLGQFDIHDDLGYGEGGRLEDPLIDPAMSLKGYTYVDSNLVRGRHYTYAVTSYTLPGITVVEQPRSGGGVDTIRLESPALESSRDKNDTLVIIPFQPSTNAGSVKVVPNPYRTDIDYTYEAGGWEGLGREWTEGKRVIWFIHLPAKSTIRIFSLTGDLVATIDHDDPIRQAQEKLDSKPRPVGQEEWNLLTGSGRAIASGVYVYTVESDYGRQIGKFVVIR